MDECLDSVYFSAVVYTTLGLDNLVPSGPICFLLGTQAPVGFTPIFSPAAFTILEARRSSRAGTGRRHCAARGTHDGRDDGN